MSMLKLPTASVTRWIKGSRALIPFTSPISSTRGRDKVLDKMLILFPELPTSNAQQHSEKQARPKPPLASLLQLHYPLSSPEGSQLLQDYTLSPTIAADGVATQANGANTQANRAATQRDKAITQTNGASTQLDKAITQTNGAAAQKDVVTVQTNGSVTQAGVSGAPAGSSDKAVTMGHQDGEGAGQLRYNEDLLIEDMDMFAADVACRHVGGLDDKRLVTAHLERLEIFRHHHPISQQLHPTAVPQWCTDSDLELFGQVVWVGRSSMEVLLELSTAAPKQIVGKPDSGTQKDGHVHSQGILYADSTPREGHPRELVGRAQFVMATRTLDLARAMPVQPLQLTNAHEEALHKEVQERTERKKLEAQERHHHNTHSPKLPVHDPLTDEQLRVISDSNSSSNSSSYRQVPMSSTARSQTVVTRSEDRNTTGSVFGGQLLVYGTTIGADVAACHAGQLCNLIQLYDVAFMALAPLKCTLQLEGHVAYAEGPLMHIRAVVRFPEHDQTPISQDPMSNSTPPKQGPYITTFWLTYETGNGDHVASVKPATQLEYRDWQHARTCIKVPSKTASARVSVA